MGFPEKSEAPTTEIFLENLLTMEVFKIKIPKFFSIERAHRVPGCPPVAEASPQTLIARFLNFRDRDLILQLFRTKGPMRFEDHDISAYPDFTVEVQRKRSSYMEVKASLRKIGLKYAFLFLAKLRVVEAGEVHFFNSPSEAWQWLHQKALDAPRPSQDEEDLNWSQKKKRWCKQRGMRGRPTPEKASD